MQRVETALVMLSRIVLLCLGGVLLFQMLFMRSDPIGWGNLSEVSCSLVLGLFMVGGTLYEIWRGQKERRAETANAPEALAAAASQ
ncbi:MAG: hypothetical protein Q8R13_00640 [bacterium]|nr:hypothetical protein [bacterium]MDZ4296364.1 hypothetical protein [Patescibacteria group bacterium]